MPVAGGTGEVAIVAPRAVGFASLGAEREGYLHGTNIGLLRVACIRWHVYRSVYIIKSDFGRPLFGKLSLRDDERFAVLANAVWTRGV